MLNSRWTDEGIYQSDQVNLGIAIAVDDGLVVPVLRSADSQQLADISKQAVRLAHKAKEHTLSQEQFSGGTFTVTDQGTISQGARGCGLRRSRYIGLGKTHLQYVFTAVAVNLIRLANWFWGNATCSHTPF